MTAKSPPLTEKDLHAYVDGQLDAARASQVEDWMAADADVAKRIRAYRAQNQALQSELDPVLEEPVPERLSGVLRHKSRVLPLRAAAVLAWMAVGGIAGYALHDWRTPTAATLLFAERAAVAHVVYASEVQHPVEVTAEQESHLVHWLSKRLGKELRTPDFTPFGFQLVGGRLLPGDKGPAAQFMYQDAHGARLTLYVSTPGAGASPTAFRYEEDDGTRVLYWIDRDLGFALVGDLDRSRLMDVAHVAYQALNF